jgi:hypothetical protein
MTCATACLLFRFLPVAGDRPRGGTLLRRQTVQHGSYAGRAKLVSSFFRSAKPLTAIWNGILGR